MNNSQSKFSQRQELAKKVATLLQKRAKLAQERLEERVRKVYDESVKELFSKPVKPWEIWTGGSRYALDFAQRSVLFWDTLRLRGNQFVERERAGLPPVLHFDYESVLEGSTLARPVNYELVRIIPPKGVKVETPTQTEIIIKGTDKQQVGQVAAEIREYRGPEPYKGKGVRYAGERVVRKAGKAAK